MYLTKMKYAVNQFVEHYRIKTVLICNEEEISDSEKYQVWKEKLIWYTYQISPLIDQIIDYLIKDYPTDTKCILEKYKHITLDLINRNDFNNIRVLKVCLSNFKLVCQTLNNLNYQNTIDSIDQDLILFIFSITIEYKKGNLKQENLEMIKRWIFQGYDFTKYGNRDSQEPSYLSKFIDCYYIDSITDNFKSLAICEYITNGYFNKDIFKEEIDNFISSIQTSEHLFIKNFRVLSNDEFSQIAKQYIQKIKHNEIKTPSFLLRLCQLLFYFSINKLISETHIELSQLFEKSIKNLSISQQLQYEDIEGFGNNYILDDPEYLQNNNEYKKIKNLIINLNNENKMKIHTQNGNRLINLLSTNPDEFFTKKKSEPTTPIFDSLDIIKLHDILWKLSNYNLNRFRYFIIRKHDFTNPKRFLSSDKKPLESLSNLIKAKLQNNSANNNTQTLNCYLIAELADEIDKVIEKLT